MKHFSLMLAMLLFVVSGALAQRMVKGTVMLEGEGEAIGATVVVDGNEGVGTVTEFDGSFSLDVPTDAKALKISYTGYQTQTVSIEGTDNVSVTLALDSEIIDEVVVVAYGKVDKEKLTGNVSVVGSESIENVPMATFDQIIQGRVPGMTVLSGEGQPGSAASVTIRGLNSIEGSTTPLYVMDGIVITAGDFATLNPNDIASVSVLKDAASASIYGSQAANGVVLITTKRGSAEGPPRVTYSTQFGMTQLARNPRYQMLSSREILDFQALVGEGPGSTLSETDIDSMAQIQTDWMDALYRTGITQSHDLTVSGGSARSDYYISASYYEQEATLRNTGLNRGNIRINSNSKVNDKFTFGIKATLGLAKSNLAENDAYSWFDQPDFLAIMGMPYERIYDDEGNYLPSGAFDDLNAVEDLNENTEFTTDLKTIASAYGEYEIIRGLRFKSQVGVDYTQTNYRDIIPPTTIYGVTNTSGGQGSAYNGQVWLYRLTGTNTLNYDKIIKDDHFITVLGGTEFIKTESRSFGFEGYGLDDKIPNESGITPGTEESPDLIASVSAGHTESRLASFFGNAQYSFGSRYNVSTGIRYDGSSRFGENNKWATFWNVGLSWNINREAFLKTSKVVSDLKLSFSYGTLGNQGGIGNFQRLASYSRNLYDGQFVGYYPSSLANPNLVWEKQKSMSLGLNYGFWKNRLRGELAVYNNVTEDLFLDIRLSYTSGFSENEINAGKIRNRGMEFLVEGDLIRTPDFTWSVNMNGAYNRSLVLDLGGVDEYVPAGANGVTIIREGESVSAYYGMVNVGVDPVTGMWLYEDLDGNYTTNYSDDQRQVIGDYQPPFTGGFGTNLSFKGFNASAFFTYAQGHLILNNDLYFMSTHEFAGLLNKQVGVLEMWNEPGDITSYGSIDSNYRDALGSTRFYEDASFIRLRNVSLSYTMPSKWFGDALQSVTVQVQAQNLATFTKFTGSDPEAFLVQLSQFPSPKVYTFGLQVGF